MSRPPKDSSDRPTVTFIGPDHEPMAANLGCEKMTNHFFSMAGYAINIWAHIDRRIFECFSHSLMAGEQKAAIVYYKWMSLGQKKDITDELITLTCNNQEIKTKWANVVSKITTLKRVRNMLAHQPIVAKSIITNTGDPDPAKKMVIENWLEVEQEEKELLNGRKKPQSITITEIVEHIREAQALWEDLINLSDLCAKEAANPTPPPLPPDV